MSQCKATTKRGARCKKQAVPENDGLCALHSRRGVASKTSEPTHIGRSKERGTIPGEPETVRLIRIFVSSPGDVQAERDILDKAVEQITRTDGRRFGVALQTFRWEKDVVPRIGSPPQKVVDQQTPDYDIYVGIMSTRFGTPAGRYGSGTKKEFKDAQRKWKKAGKPWIAFYFDSRPQLSGEPEEALQYAEVCTFRKELEQLGIVAKYAGVRGSDAAFYEKVSEHLRKIIHQLAANVPKGQIAPSPADPTTYLRDLLTNTQYIDIRGLVVGKGQAHRFPIEELFITLTASQAPKHPNEKTEKGPRTRRVAEAEARARLPEDRTMPLHASLRNDRLVVVGDPGAGKTTFLRRVVHTLCQSQLGDAPDAASQRLGITNRTFPIFVRLSDLAQHLLQHRNNSAAPTGEDAPAWLTHYLAAASEANKWGLDAKYFEQQLESHSCTVLLDGLDEAPDRILRERLSRLIVNVAGAYKGCRFVITSRPAAYTGEVILPEFAHAEIDPLSEEAVETFLSRWCGALYGESPTAAEEHCAELLSALRARPDIRRMARNPVMLTALAVVHWNERRLPEQRADLYESVIRWLSRSREQRPGRERADRTVELLRELALAMQDHPDGLHTRVSKRWAAESLAKEWATGEVDTQSIARAERFLDAEELDSGIIVGKGNEVHFWHRTFQEYLVARAIAARAEAEQQSLLWGPPVRLYSPEWREVILLLGGILNQFQGRAKVDNLIRVMLERLGQDAKLEDQARCAGLLGAMLRDLAPVDYEPPDRKYGELLDCVMAIFDRERSESVPIETRIAAADALGQAGDPRIDPKRDDYWVTIPAGKFLMGAQGRDPEKPNYDAEAIDEGQWSETPHEVYLDAYRIGRFPVTVGQYEKFVEDEGYQTQRWWEGGGFGNSSAPDDWEQQLEYPSRPVTGVSWYEAAAFCAWWGFRLPTEAEWERAARGREGRKYPWGDEPADPSRLNYEGCGINHATPVGIYPMGATPEGISDLAGNVDEWCFDGFGIYSKRRASNPRGPKQASDRVIRGGGWFNFARGCRSAIRNGDSPEFRNGNLGFRVAAVPSGK